MPSQEAPRRKADDAKKRHGRRQSAGGTAVTRGTGRPLKHTARGELGLLLVITVA